MRSSASRCAGVLAVLAVFVIGPVGASGDAKAPTLLNRGIRAMGMGEAYEAVANDSSAFEYNPAGIAHFRRFSLDLFMQGRATRDLAEEAAEFEDLTRDIDALVGKAEGDPANVLTTPEAQVIVDRLERIRAENLKGVAHVPVASVVLPLPDVAGIRLVGGASVSNQVLVGARMERAGLRWGSPVLDVLDDDIVLQAAADILTVRAAVAGEMDLPDLPLIDRARCGLSYRIISRRYMNDRFAIIDMLDPEAFRAEHFDTSMLDDGSIDSFADALDFLEGNTTKETGFGIDAGFQVDHTDYLTTALVLRNLASKLGDEKFPATRTIAVAGRPLQFLKMDNALLDVLVAASLSNGAGDDFLVDFRNRTIADKLHLGAEATLFPRSPFRVTGRIGNNQGFLTAGATVRLAVLEVGVAYYGDLEADWLSGNVRFVF